MLTDNPALQSNAALYDYAKHYMTGGVNSPVRSFNAVGGTPFFTTRAHDCYLYDVEHRRYIDYICSWGANIVGHANPYVISKITDALHNGLSFGTASALEVELALKITSLVPSIQKLRLVSSGTEAVMSAIRLARGYTGKKYIIKFAGCYHGHSDGLLVKAGSGVATFTHNTANIASSSGVLEEHIVHTLVLDYNSTNSLESAFKTHANDIAAVIIEPFVGNMNLVRPNPQFMDTLAGLCKQHQTVLIFDEVMTGFRVSLGCAQQLLNITPDITILGKVVGGGMPLAAFGGRAEIMDYLSPLGTVYQAGTLSGNPVAVSAGLATLELICAPGFYDTLTKTARNLTSGLLEVAKQHHVEFSADAVGGMFGFYFMQQPPTNFNQIQQANASRFKQFFHYMLDSGVYFAPSMFEAGFVCSMHSDGVINQTLELANAAFSKL